MKWVIKNLSKPSAYFVYWLIHFFSRLKNNSCYAKVVWQKISKLPGKTLWNQKSCLLSCLHVKYFKFINGYPPKWIQHDMKWVIKNLSKPSAYFVYWLIHFFSRLKNNSCYAKVVWQKISKLPGKTLWNQKSCLLSCLHVKYFKFINGYPPKWIQHDMKWVIKNLSKPSAYFVYWLIHFFSRLKNNSCYAKVVWQKISKTFIIQNLSINI